MDLNWITNWIKNWFQNYIQNWRIGIKLDTELELKISSILLYNVIQYYTEVSSPMPTTGGGGTRTSSPRCSGRRRYGRRRSTLNSGQVRHVAGMSRR